MILYRGYTKVPVFFTPELEKELAGLKDMAREFVTPESMNYAGFAAKYGDQVMNRHFELSSISRSQEFSDQKKVAEAKAGKDGFVLTIDIPDQELKKLSGSETVISGLPSSNFKIPASELNKFNQEGKCRIEAIKSGLGESGGGPEGRI